jgi:hypothetical protein
MIRWERGRAEIDQLLAQGRLTRVAANTELASSYIAQAKDHLASAASIRAIDISGAFTLAYDAARMSLAAVLLNQGLRPRGEGAHAVLLEALIAQLEPPRQNEFREFDWMRRLRNDTQYPDIERPTAASDDLDQAIPATQLIIDRAVTLIVNMPPY